jgi:hypothetical protein
MIKTTVLTYRNAYAGLFHSTWLLSLIMLINRSGTMVVPFMTLYLTTIENSTRSYTLSRLAINIGWTVGDAIGSIPAKLIMNYYLAWMALLICGAIHYAGFPKACQS